MKTCFEHEPLTRPSEVVKALHRHYGEGKPYYSLIANGVKFNQFVGVLQVGAFTIEVLPKVDRAVGGTENQWRGVLMQMLHKVENLPLLPTDEADLSLHHSHVLDLYIALFLKEVAYLMHQGLAKTYHTTQGNRLALKGRLVMSRHIQENLIHAERFHVAHSIYDSNTPHNRLLRKALQVILRTCHQGNLRGDVARLILDFPELPDIVVNESTFQRLPWNRKTEGYRRAIHIARLILLHYHPDVSRGSDHVLALMFDMNKLWEAYVLADLRRHAPEEWTVEAQMGEEFWSRTDTRERARLYPDIVLTGPHGRRIVLDTKWKLQEGRPSDQDLRQLFAYQHVFKADQGYFVYPGKDTQPLPGQFHHGPYSHCHLLEINVLAKDGRLNPDLGKHIWNQILLNQDPAATAV